MAPLRHRATTTHQAGPNPRHVGVIMDGNRRWARAAGFSDTSIGHRAGADHLADLLGWLHERRISHASVYVLSADNIRKRTGKEVDYLFELIRTVVPVKVRESDGWQLHVAGDLSLLPPACREALTTAMADTAGRPAHLTLAIGYDAREDVAEAVRRLLRESGSDIPSGDGLSDAITAAMTGGPIKEIDLVIRTSGEQRMSGFFPWRSQAAEIHVSKKMWPAFTERDLDLALEDYRRRRAPAAVVVCR